MRPLNGKAIDYAEAARLYLSGMSLPKVAAALGSTGPTILRALQRTGTPTRSISDAVSLASRGDRHVSNGYVTVTVGKADRRKEHIIVAERALGRRLKSGECVHHVNCDTTDNRPENLLICTRAYHIALHWRMRRDPYWSQIEKANRK